ncbi:unnamed protein product, partial [Ectocarpus sp. 12 AP-2014]
RFCTHPSLSAVDHEVRPRARPRGSRAALAEGPDLSRSRGWVVTRVDVAAAHAHRQDFSRAHASAEPLRASSPNVSRERSFFAHHKVPCSGAEDKVRKHNLEAQVKRYGDSARTAYRASRSQVFLLKSYSSASAGGKDGGDTTGGSEE